MNRRDVIKSFGIVPLHALFPSVLSGFLASCGSGNNKTENNNNFPDHQKVIMEVVDTIIPKTTTGSATETGVHHFIIEVFDKCFNTEQKELMDKGIEELKKEWPKQPDKIKYLKELDERAYKGDEDYAWFKVLKQYTMIGFFTSMEGTTKAGNYQKIPEKYIGEVTIDDAALAQSKTFLKYYL